jgi:branched-chain amino acid transport system ATP-binding protein
MLRLENIHSYYGDSHVLQGVSLEVLAGKCTALVGRNGAGKTTTILSILGYVVPRRGQVIYNGHDITGTPTHRTIALGIGYVPEDRGIFSSLTVDEHLQVAWVANRNRPNRQSAEAIYEIFPRLAERRNSYGNQLSGGEQQMLSIGRALVGSPEMLILDEPNEGLAPVIVDLLEDKLLAIKHAGTSILLVEQFHSVLHLADHVYLLSQGRVHFSGSPRELAANDDVKRKYLGV